jgi:hypothetical protein
LRVSDAIIGATALVARAMNRVARFTGKRDVAGERQRAGANLVAASDATDTGTAGPRGDNQWKATMRFD